jgi:exopolysaccharide biosynthesis polyprenyl glycosylphosphotransferase
MFKTSAAHAAMSEVRMEIGRKSTLGLGYDTQSFPSHRHVFRGSSVVTSLLILLAVAVTFAIIYPGISAGSPWLQIAMLVAAVAILPRTGDYMIAGTGPGVAIVSAILASQPGSRVVHQSTSLRDARNILRSVAVQKVIVADSLAYEGAAPLEDARGLQPEVVDATDAVGELLGRIPYQLIDTDAIRDAVGRQSILHRGFKRAGDIAFSLGIGLLVLPIIPLVALVIRLDSPGNPFYSQERVGLNGTVFRIHKFRSMRKDAEKNGAVWAQAADSRVTRVGRFLRLSRIDEIPQLWNVLRGDMTLIGPRPERPEFTSMLELEIPGYELRTLVKPGLTGWAQVSYRYTNSVLETRTKLEYDLYYVKYASVGLDLRILFRTIAVVIKMRGC